MADAKTIVTTGKGLDAENKVKHMTANVRAAELAVATLGEMLDNLKVKAEKLEKVIEILEEADDGHTKDDNSYNSYQQTLVNLNMRKFVSDLEASTSDWGKTLRFFDIKQKCLAIPTM